MFRHRGLSRPNSNSVAKTLLEPCIPMYAHEFTCTTLLTTYILTHICSGFIPIWITKYKRWLREAHTSTKEEARLPKEPRECRRTNKATLLLTLYHNYKIYSPSHILYVDEPTLLIIYVDFLKPYFDSG